MNKNVTSGGLRKRGILKKEDVKDNAFEFYKNPDPEKVKDNGSEMHWFSNYKKWILPSKKSLQHFFSRKLVQ